MSKVRGRAGSPGRNDLTSRPGQRFLMKRAFEKKALPEPPRVKKPQVYIHGRSPLRSFYYTKGARGKWHSADRVTRGTRWNAYLCSGTAIPKGTRPEVFKAPPAVSGILSSLIAAKAMEYHAAHITLQGNHANKTHIEIFHHHHAGVFRDSLKTGWIDVPMPGALTQFSQGRHTKPGGRKNQHVAPVAKQAVVPVMRISLQAAPFQRAPAQKQQTWHAAEAKQPQEAFKKTPAAAYPRTVFTNQGAVSKGKAAPAAKETRMKPAPIPSSKPARLSFRAMRAVKAELFSSGRAGAAAAQRTEDKKPAEFHAKAPKTERIRRTPEIRAQEIALAPAYSAQPIRIDEMRLPHHIGYIPSVKKKERQLKVAQGSEGIPPQ